MTAKLKALAAIKGHQRAGKPKRASLSLEEGLAALAALRRGATLRQVAVALGMTDNGGSALLALGTWARHHCKCLEPDGSQVKGIAWSTLHGEEGEP